MTKRLINKLGRGIKRVGKPLVAGLISVGLTGFLACSDMTDIPTPNSNPDPNQNSPPKITSILEDTEINEGEFYSRDIEATDEDGDNLTAHLNNNYGWLSIDSIGTNKWRVSGTVPETDSDINYNIGIEVSDGEGFDTADCRVIAKNIDEPEPIEPEPIEPDYVDISGSLQDNETDTGREGLVRVYDNTNEDFLGEFVTDSSGNFNLTLDELVEELPDGVKLKARISDSDWENGTSYVRTINLPAGDQSNVTTRCVPYPDFDTDNDGDIDATDYENFKQHMYDINDTFSKWDLENGLDKIKIFRYNGSEGTFSDKQIALIESKIKDSNDIEKFVDGKELDDYIEVVNDSPSEYWEDKCIYVVPDTTPGGGEMVGCTYIKRASDRTIYRTRIELDPIGIDVNYNGTVTHEFGHAFVAPDGEAETLPDSLTIQRTDGNGNIPKIADEKAGKIVYENTYQHTDKYGLDDVLERVLGLN